MKVELDSNRILSKKKLRRVGEPTKSKRTKEARKKRSFGGKNARIVMIGEQVS